MWDFSSGSSALFFFTNSVFRRGLKAPKIEGEPPEKKWCTLHRLIMPRGSEGAPFFRSEKFLIYRGYSFLSFNPPRNKLIFERKRKVQPNPMAI